MLFWMTVLTGVLYPLAVTGIAQLVFPREANGSLVLVNGEVRGSSLLSQKVESGRFFRARPSATDYAYVGSGASNLAATNPALAKSVEANRTAWKEAFGGAAPAEMLYASASGLDPDISLEAALAQVDGIAAARGYNDAMKSSLIAELRREASASVSLLGPERVNVTALNAELETESKLKGSK
jgi:K+-transporting ATPase ATPase C chain